MDCKFSEFVHTFVLYSYIIMIIYIIVNFRLLDYRVINLQQKLQNLHYCLHDIMSTGHPKQVSGIKVWGLDPTYILIA